MYAAPPPQPAKKSSNGCLIALGIVGGVLLLVLLVGGIVVYKIVSSPEAQKVFTAVGEGVEITKEAMNAPGTPELRSAGCNQAMVMDVKRFEQLAEKLAPDGAAPRAKPAGVRLIVTCQVGGFSRSTITCDDVASTYVKAVGTAAGTFVATVQREGGGRATCSEKYDADGTHLGAWDAGR